MEGSIEVLSNIEVLPALGGRRRWPDDRGRAADRGRDRPCAHLQIPGPLSVVPASADNCRDMSGTEVELDRPQDLLNALPVKRDGAMGA